MNLGSEGPVTTGDIVRGIENALQAQDVFTVHEGEKFVIAGKEGAAAKITSEVRQLPETLRRRPPGNSVGTAAASNSSKPTEEMLPAGTINFFQTDLDQVLRIFQELCSRTLIRPETLPSPSITLQTSTPLTRAEALFAFNAVFAVNDISIVQAGEKFLIVVPTFETNRVAGLLARRSPAIVQAGKDPLPAGTLNFRAIPVRSLMPIFQELRGQPVEMEAGLPDARLTFVNQTPLTYGEALRGIDLLLGLQDLAVVEQQDGKSLKLVRLKQTTSEKH
ncbi:MAG TPA: hypothetical protein VN578_03840 [Candidatus Binatia bacterium]|nr:hypothetical protein [Candidatus Binatia bacterium]